MNGAKDDLFPKDDRFFPTIWGAKEPQNLPNHRVVVVLLILKGPGVLKDEDFFQKNRCQRSRLFFYMGTSCCT